MERTKLYNRLQVLAKEYPGDTKNSFLVDKSVLKPCMAPFYRHGPHRVESIMVVMVGVGVTMTKASISMREENYKKSLTVIFMHALIR